MYPGYVYFFFIVGAEPFHDFGMIGVLLLGQGFKCIVEARQAAAIVGRGIVLAASIARIRDP
jgi:hypothetical protein